MFEIPEHYRKYYVSYKKIKKNIIKMSKKYKKKLEKESIHNAAKQIDKQGIKMLPPFLYNDIISHEIEKVNKFGETKYNEIINNLISIYKMLKMLDLTSAEVKNTKYGVGTDVRTDLLGDMETQLDLMGCDIIHFNFYIYKNSKIIMKLGFFFDKIMNISINQWMLLGLIKQKFCNIDVEQLIIYLSHLYTILNKLKQNNNNKCISNKDTLWKPPDIFERTSYKFLIKYDDIVFAKVKIVKHLPYLIFGMKNEDIEQHFKYMIETQKGKEEITMGNVKDGNDDIDSSGNNKIDSLKKICESQQITSVYFDNKQAICYSNRILRFENAQLIRFRWYNDNEDEPNKIIFVERKTHHEEWTGEKSTKERFELEQKYLLKYMNGQLNIKKLMLQKFIKNKKEILQQLEIQNSASCVKDILINNTGTNIDHYNNNRNSIKNKNSNSNKNGVSKKQIKKNIQNLKKKVKKNIKLATEIQHMIVKNNLKPIIRTSYLRSAFQLSNDNSVRISIDINVAMINEYVSKREHWCRLAAEVLAKNEVTRLNYGILEVKLTTGEIPQWITNILNSSQCINTYKYSKYQTAMALLHPDKIKYIPIWIYTNIHKNFISTQYSYEFIPKGMLTGYDKVEPNAQLVDVGYTDGIVDKQTDEYTYVHASEHTGGYTDIYVSGYTNKHVDEYTHNKIINNVKGLNICKNKMLTNWELLQKTSTWLNNKYNHYMSKHKQINLLKLDPKVNFAAERTFLRYCLFSVYITMFVIFLGEYKNENTNNYIIISILLITAYLSLISSYFFFLNRVDIIQ
ncbi:vacuolar transporter chaperone, putative, partial [Hepatocystis sp. ex Piliocolobus tephrosceles]